MGGALKLLQLGQTVRVQQLEFACSLTILPPGEPGLTVIEVGVDYAVFEDAAEGVKMRIPMHLMKLEVPGTEAAPAPEPVPAAA